MLLENAGATVTRDGPIGPRRGRALAFVDGGIAWQGEDTVLAVVVGAATEETRLLPRRISGAQSSPGLASTESAVMNSEPPFSPSMMFAVARFVTAIRDVVRPDR